MLTFKASLMPIKFERADSIAAVKFELPALVAPVILPSATTSAFNSVPLLPSTYKTKCHTIHVQL
jgi:hypothetical protein